MLQAGGTNAASLAAVAAEVSALLGIKPTLKFCFFPFVFRLLFGSGELWGWLLWRALLSFWRCISRLFTRCGPGAGRWVVNWTAQVEVQGNAKEGVKADPEGFGLGACSGVEGWGES